MTITEYAQALVAEAPPLTPEQIESAARILASPAPDEVAA